jgi:hypothetical protein
MNPHTPKCTPTLRIGILMEFQIFKEVCQMSKLIGSNSSLYHWKALEIYMFKMDSHGPFKYLKHKLWPKEGPKIKVLI